MSVHAFPGLSLLMVIKHTPPHGNVQVQSNSQGKVRGKKRDTTLPNNSPVIAACHICVKLISKISAGRSYHCGGDRRGKSASGSATHPPGRLEEKMRRTPGTGEPGGPSPRPLSPPPAMHKVTNTREVRPYFRLLLHPPHTPSFSFHASFSQTIPWSREVHSRHIQTHWVKCD